MGDVEKGAAMTQIRAVLHAHSTWSYDGKHSLSQIAKFYGALGVRAVMMTEHDTGFQSDQFSAYQQACADASTPRCTLIPGIEYSSPDNRVHILTWGLDRFLGEHRPVLDTLLDVNAAGGVAIFAHPIRQDAWDVFDPAWVPYLAGIELWNRKSDGITWGTQAQDLIAQTGLPATVGHDFHRLRQIYPLTQIFDVDLRKPLGPQCVTAIAKAQTTPQVFRRELDLQSTFHPKLETMRCKIRDAVRYVRGR
jgi:predicted metal-dependent phosphoesterase TrpH